MKSKHCIHFVLGILFTLILPSCREENSFSKFKPIMFDSAGIELNPTNNIGQLTAQVSQEGSTFVLTPYKEQEKDAFITNIEIDGKPIYRSGYLMEENEPKFIGSPRPVIYGDWGQIQYWYNDNPYAIIFNIKENTSNKPRKFIFTIGYAYTHCELIITQNANKSN